ncbi:MAG: tetratricopeptide repeat protein, partial [bacterium]
ERIEEIELVLDKYRLYESIKRIIEIGERRKVIVIDNMQWVDRETTEVIKYLLRSLKDSPIVFILTYRQEEKTQVLDDFISYISRETEIREIGLRPFAYNNINEMMKAILGEDPERELVGYIERESGGNAFYIEEILKGLNQIGCLKIIGDVWQFENPDKEIIPKSIEDITARKYQSLSNEGKELLQLASVIGGFDTGIMKEITGYNEGHVVGLIEDAKRLGLIKESGDRFEFQDEISRNAVYKRYVAGAKGRMLHRQIGEKLEEQYKSKEHLVLEELAFHYYQGAQKEKGVRYCIKAGDSARAKYANTSAIQYYTWAEYLLMKSKDKKDTKLRIDCILKRVNVLDLVGKSEVALKDLEKCLQYASGIRDKKRKTDIKTRRAEIYLSISQYHKAIAEATECIKMYNAVSDKKKIAGLLNTVGNAQLYMGQYKKALKNYDGSLKMYRAIEDRMHETRVLNNIGITYRQLGQYDKALGILKDSLEMKRSISDKSGESRALAALGVLYGSLGRYDKALECNENSLKILKEIGDKIGEARITNNIGTIYNYLGNNNQALKIYEDSLTLKKNIEDRVGEAGTLNNIGNVHLELGTYDKALKYYEDSLELAETIKADSIEFSNFLSLGDLYLKANKRAKAKSYIDKAYEMARESDSKNMLRDVLISQCGFCLETKKLTEFKKPARRLQSLLRKMKSRRFEGIINLLLGRYYTETGDLESAKKHLTKSLRISKDIGERLTVGRTYYYLGMMGLAIGEKAIYRGYFKKALEIFDSLGAKGWKEKVEKALSNC